MSVYEKDIYIYIYIFPQAELVFFGGMKMRSLIWI